MFRFACLAAVAAVVLSGCATPAGKLTDADFSTRTVDVDLPIARAYGNFYQGLRYCGPTSGGVIFVTHHGIPDCAPARPDGSLVCDLYVGGDMGRSQYVLGRAEFFPQPGGTRAKFGVRPGAAGREKILDAWVAFMNGREKAVCPD